MITKIKFKPGSIIRLSEVDDGPVPFNHGVPLVMVDQVGQGLKHLTRGPLVILVVMVTTPVSMLSQLERSVRLLL